MQASRATQNESTVVQTMKRLMESKKAQMLIALILVLVAIKLYLPASSEPRPDVHLVSGTTGSSTPDQSLSAVMQYQNSLEKQLTEILQQIKGAGDVKVMLTLASTSDVHIAKNLQVTSRNTEEKDLSGGTKTVTEQTHSSQPVMARGGTSTEGVVTLKETTPEIRGVVVVASGAGNPAVRASLSQAVQTILSMPAHKVSVFPGK